MFEENTSIFSRLQELSIYVDRKLRSLPFYNVLSNELSPVKVIAAKDENENLLKVHDHVRLMKFLFFC